jgi:hypothetical protein
MQTFERIPCFRGLSIGIGTAYVYHEKGNKVSGIHPNFPSALSIPVSTFFFQCSHQALTTTNSKFEQINGGKIYFAGKNRKGGSERPGEDLGIEILADVQGGSVDGLCPELLLVRPELGLLCGGAASPPNMGPRLSVRVSRARTKGNGGERRILTDWMVDWSGCGGARSALTPALRPKRRVSWVSLISLFMLPLAIVDALRLLLARSRTRTCLGFFLCVEERKRRDQAVWAYNTVGPCPLFSRFVGPAQLRSAYPARNIVVFLVPLEIASHKQNMSRTDKHT